MAKEQLLDLTRFQDKLPEQAAALVLIHYEGDARNAEVELWRNWSAYAGGEPGRRREDDSQECKYLISVIRHIVEGTEMPKVPRKQHDHALTGAFRTQ